MTINELIEESHRIAIEKGWWENDRNFGDIISLMHSELSEAFEEYRSNRGMNEIYVINDKPEGIPTELADLLIRVFDFCGRHKIDLEKALMIKMAYNKKRAFRHGNKRA